MDECHSLHLRVDATGADPDRLDAVRDALAAARSHRLCDIRLDRVDFPSLRAMVNGERALLIYRAGSDDPGAMARAPDSESDLEDDEEIEYLSGAGEWDSYPAGLSLPTAEAFRLLEWFALHGSRPETVSWYAGPSGDAAEPDDAF